MRELFRKLWSDDSGAVVSTEYVLVSGLVVGGVGSGMVAVRNAGIRQANALADAISATSIPSPDEVRQATAMPTNVMPQHQTPAVVIVVNNSNTILPPSP